MRATTQSTRKKATKSKPDIAASYNRFKQHDGKLYTGVTVGRGHTWH